MAKIKLRSLDDELFEVDEGVAFQSVLIKNMVEDTGSNVAIPLSNVTGKILAKVIEYCKFHISAPKTSSSSGFDSKSTSPGPSDEDIKAFDADFVKVDQETLFDLILAANYLNIQSLLDLTCQTVADMIKNKTPEEIRRIFNIQNDFTPEEEDEVRRENQWAFE
ncbi:hypothetical protein KP509_18G083400 [Ceratopteris richardii]|uniref:SKP1-like protein n=1 Tax=Ceratopteris richardii TaxID=49495 RepID=A0A8T2SRI0_CERRI|nr:hypothetical protein KP509_18G083400 [Ceratopteris richardii]